jgi:hypothetical protein
MRLKTEVEELKRESKKKMQQIEPKGAEAAEAVAAPALTSALARVRARRGTATGAKPT